MSHQVLYPQRGSSLKNLNEQTNGKRPKFWDEVMNVFTWINRDVWLWMSEIHIQSWWQWSTWWNMFWSIELFNFFFPSKKNFTSHPQPPCQMASGWGGQTYSLGNWPTWGNWPTCSPLFEKKVSHHVLYPQRGSSLKNLKQCWDRECKELCCICLYIGYVWHWVTRLCCGWTHPGM